MNTGIRPKVDDHREQRFPEGLARSRLKGCQSAVCHANAPLLAPKIKRQTVTLTPTVSIVMPSYNHAKFVAASIGSVLRQSMSEFELIVVDDASSDQSRQAISSFKDDRIRTHFLDENRGGAEALNIGIDICRGHFVAICNSDDTWEPHKLETQLKVMEQTSSVGAVFSAVRWIGPSGEPLSGKELPYFSRTFEQQNRPRFSWLRSLIEDGNTLCHPSVLIRRDVYRNVGVYRNWLRQLPDLDMWLRVLQHCEIFVDPKPLVNFRLHGANVSTPTASTGARDLEEYRLIATEFFRKLSADDFEHFTVLGDMSKKDDVDLLISKGRYLVSSPGRYGQILRSIGLDLLYEASQSRRGSDRMEELKLGAKWFHTQHPQPVNSVQSTRTVDLAKTIASRLRRKLLQKIPIGGGGMR